MAITFNCPGCSRQLTVRDDAAGMNGKCPGCGIIVNVPEAKPPLIILPGQEDPEDAPRQGQSKMKLSVWLMLAGLGTILIIVISPLFFPGPSDRPPDKAPPSLVAARPPVPDQTVKSKESVPWQQQSPQTAQPAPSGRAASPSVPTPSRRVTVSYLNLVDLDAITHSGDTVRDVIKELSRLGEGDTEARSYYQGLLQPFLEPFSSLLPDALALSLGPDALPRSNVADAYPNGVRQPVWAAITRSGRIIVTDDGNARASVFLQGDNPSEAYRTQYGVLRHILAALLPPNGGPLKVSIYTFGNDFASCSFSLDTTPMVLDITTLPSPEAKLKLDLAGLKDFFDGGIELAGGKIDPQRGLILVGKKSAEPKIGGRAVNLSDLAVAYRAVFHAEKNDAYISLDKHRDPTRVTVNFGGLLEDTRLGGIVLASDERFKTITSGMDPSNYEDRRSYARRYVPAFLSCSERGLIEKVKGENGWISTRLWYYPDSVQVDTDFDYKYAIVSRAQFTADAERETEGSGNPPTLSGIKPIRPLLDPSIRQGIDHLNSNYSQYASAFPELRELSDVARLMGVCVWLQRAGADKVIDLDALLQVELPEWNTPRDRNQILAVTSLVETPLSKATPANKDKVATRCFSDVLDEPIEKVFGSESELARYLTLRDAGQPPGVDPKTQAQQTWEEYRARPARSVIQTKRAVEVFLMYLSDRVKPELPDEVMRLKALIEKESDGIKELERQIAELADVMKLSVDSHNANVDKYNELVARYQQAVKDSNLSIEKFNAMGGELTAHQVLEISGGIDLGPKEYAVRMGFDSPELRNLRAVSDSVERGVLRIGSETWVRSGPGDAAKAPKTAFIGCSWDVKKSTGEAGGILTHASSNGRDYWLMTGKDSREWRDQWDRGDGKVRCRFANAKGDELQIADFADGVIRRYVVGKREGTDRIGFSRTGRTDLVRPQSPPHWWTKTESAH